MENLKNEITVKDITDTPFYVRQFENGNIAVTYGNHVIAKGYTSIDQAETEIHEMCSNWPLLLNVIVTTIDKYNELNNENTKN